MFSKIKYKICAGAVVVMFMMGSCRDAIKYPGYEFFPEMYRGPAYETYEPSTLFADSLSSLKPVAGTIPRGFTTFNYANTNEDYVRAGLECKSPLPGDSANLMEGKRLYEIYCVNCHGSEGNGDGNLVADNKFPGAPPSYSKGNSSRGGAMKDLSDGKIYHAITYGLNLMGPHAGQLDPKQRWQVVQYVHTLQNLGQADAAATTAAVDSSQQKNQTNQ